MPFFSNIKKALNFGSSTDNKKRKLISNIKTDINPEDVWEILCDIGDGAFGKVHKARHREDQDRCVDTINMMIYEREKSQEMLSGLIRSEQNKHLRLQNVVSPCVQKQE